MTICKSYKIVFAQKIVLSWYMSVGYPDIDVVSMVIFCTWLLNGFGLRCKFIKCIAL